METVKKVFVEKWDLIDPVLKRNPALAASDTFWISPVQVKKQLLETIERHPMKEQKTLLSKLLRFLDTLVNNSHKPG